MAKRKKVTRKRVPQWTIECKDCIKGMKALREGDTGVRPSLIFADPPFNIGYEYDKHDDNQDVKAYHEWCAEWLAEVYQLLHKHGTFWLAICDEHVSELDVMAKGLGFHRRSWVVWYYTFGVACQKTFSRSHTHLLYYTKTKSRFTWTGDTRVPSARQLVYNDKRANPKGKLPDNTWVLAPEDTQKAFVHEDGKWLDTWLASRICGTFHERVDGAANQMPQEIMERIVKACSKPGDLVLDPFGGTFSTGEAALRLDRDFHGFDISKNYCRKGKDRLKAVLAKAAGNL